MWAHRSSRRGTGRVYVVLLLATTFLAAWLLVPRHPTRQKAVIPDILQWLHYTHRDGPIAQFEVSWRSAGVSRISFYDDDSRDALVQQWNPPWFSLNWHRLAPVEKSDVFRYVVVWRYGGLYVDSDAWPEVGVAGWLPEYEFVDTLEPDFILGLEFLDAQVSMRGMQNPFQLCQWTFASIARSPLLSFVLDFINRTAAKNMALSLDPLLVTGPAVWTTAILQFLQEYGIPKGGLGRYPACMDRLEKLEIRGQQVQFFHSGRTWKGLVLPKRAFGFHPDHADHPAADANPIGRPLVVHEFEGSWKP